VHHMDMLTVARRAKVSTATVSRVLSGSRPVTADVAARVRAAIEELNYTPNSHARSLRSGKSNLFGLLVSDVRNPFFPDAIEHFESLATAQGIDVIFSNTGYSPERLMSGLRRLLDRGVDGIAVLTSEVSDEMIHTLRNVKVPVVFLNQPTVQGNFPIVRVDYERGYREAMEHLSMLGHKDIGFVSGPNTLFSAVRRKEVFLQVAKDCGFHTRNEWLIEGDHRLGGGKIAAARFFTMRAAPTAILCSNDLTAIGFIHTANRLKRSVPQEISVVGFDDIAMSEMVQPALTTLHLSRREIAAHAFFALQNGDDRRNSKAMTSTVLPQLVIRESTGIAPEKSRVARER
jgi:DNA-binding LacI/PurR family transcriptional regulator